VRAEEYPGLTFDSEGLVGRGPRPLVCWGVTDLVSSAGLSIDRGHPLPRLRAPISGGTGGDPRPARRPVAERPDGQNADARLDPARHDVRLSESELFLCFFALGGMSGSMRSEAFLIGALLANSRGHDVLAHALNDRLSELGGSHPLPPSADT
jgi:hypothetical protein